MKTLIVLISLLALHAQAAPRSARPAPSRARTAPKAVLASDAPVPAPQEIAYFQDLLKRADSAPIEDFFHLWFPNDVQTVTNSYLDRCINFNANEMIRQPDKTLSQDCKPDVLYSWGPLVKLETIRKEFKNGVSWNKPVNGGRSVWMTISPISTFSYGPIPIRFKFKPNTRFAFGFSDAGVNEHTGEMMDFIFDKGDVLESWSFGMPQHYDEIIKDIRQFAKTTTALTYSGHVGQEPDYKNIYIAGVMERGAQNEEVLRANLTLMIRMILEKKGEVHFAPGTEPSVQQHFATDHPTYFNER